MLRIIAGLLLLVGVSATSPSFAQPNAPVLVVTPLDFAEGEGEEPVMRMLTRLYEYALSQPFKTHPIYASFGTFQSSITTRYPFLVTRDGLRRTVSRRELREHLHRGSDGRMGMILPHLAMTDRQVATRPSQLPLPAAAATPVAVASDTAPLLRRITALEQRLAALPATAQGVNELRTALRDLTVRVNGAATATDLTALAGRLDQLSGRIDGRVETLDRRVDGIDGRVTTLSKDVADYVRFGALTFIAIAIVLLIVLLLLLWFGLSQYRHAKQAKDIVDEVIETKDNTANLKARVEELERQAGRTAAASPPAAAA